MSNDLIARITHYKLGRMFAGMAVVMALTFALPGWPWYFVLFYAFALGVKS